MIFFLISILSPPYQYGIFLEILSEFLFDFVKKIISDENISIRKYSLG